MGNNIKKCNLDENKVDSLLNKLQLKQEDILLMLVTGGDDFYLQPKKGKFVSGKISEEVG